MQALGQTVFTGTALPLSNARCTGRSRGNVCIRAVAAPAKLDTRKSEQVLCSHNMADQLSLNHHDSEHNAPPA
jgi:hypothetical protein